MKIRYFRPYVQNSFVTLIGFCGEHEHRYEISEGGFSIILTFKDIQPTNFLKNIKERVDFIHFFRNIFYEEFHNIPYEERLESSIQYMASYYISQKFFYPSHSPTGKIIQILFGDNFHPSFTVNLQELN